MTRSRPVHSPSARHTLPRCTGRNLRSLAIEGGVATSAQYFDALATHARWRCFSAVENRKVRDFTRRWRIAPGDRVLEPGCGSGRLTRILAALTGPTGKVLAFDASAAFTKLARHRRLPRQVTVRTAFALSLELDPASFDHIVCFNVFPHLMPLGKHLRLLARALRPGGRLWIAHTCSRSFVNRMHRHASAALRDHLLPAPRELRRLLATAGLRVIAVESRRDRFFAGAVRPVQSVPAEQLNST